MKMKSKLVVLLVAVVAIAGILVGSYLLNARDESAIQAGFNPEFMVRPDGYAAVKKTYGLRFADKPRQMAVGAMYKACADKNVDVISAFATDGRIALYKLVVLTDDKHAFPPYYAAPLVRAETLQKHPELQAILDRLADRIDARTMQKLNLEVDRPTDSRKPEETARNWLLESGLVAADDKVSDGSAGTITIGSKNFSEQYILLEVVAQLIETQTKLRVVRKRLGGTINCFNAVRSGDMDMYVEYTGTGLVNILKHEPMTDPREVYDLVSREFRQKYDLVWGKPLGFNNTYTLTMRKAQAKALGIESISDLAAYVKNH